MRDTRVARCQVVRCQVTRCQVSGAELFDGNRLAFACPVCRARLARESSDILRCPNDAAAYTRVDGIWRFLSPQRALAFAQFAREYEAVRRDEGRGSVDAAYYRSLPFDDVSGRFADLWRIRARSFRALVEQVVQPLEQARRRPLTILDLGAGNGWLSYRLAQRGHSVAAIDLLVNSTDGLGAHVHYDAAFVPVQAEFDCLPCDAHQADLVVFDGSLHYSLDYETTLGEAMRVLRGDGRLAILDSPTYREAASGEWMAQEREARWMRRHGFRSNALLHENYLTYARLDDLAARLRLCWQVTHPSFGWRWAVRRSWARLRARREPARFPLIVGKHAEARA